MKRWAIFAAVVLDIVITTGLYLWVLQNLDDIRKASTLLLWTVFAGIGLTMLVIAGMELIFHANKLKGLALVGIVITAISLMVILITYQF